MPYKITRDKECQRCHSLVKFNAKGLPITHQASHFQGRRKEGTRFYELNADTLCHGCHSYFTANPAEHYAWQVRKKSQAAVDLIILVSNTYSKKNRSLEAVYWSQRLKQDFGV
jgi:hypothetical protein